MTTIQPPPAGFPKCKKCPHVWTGTPSLCLGCVLSAVTPISTDHCPVCYQTLSGPDDQCRNWLCRNPRRSISCIHAIAALTSTLKTRIVWLKEGRWGWGTIFGRIVVGWLDQQLSPGRYDLIVHNPGYVEPGETKWLGHTAAVMTAARTEDALGLYPFADPADGLLTLASRPPKSKAHGRDDKLSVAKEIYAALRLKDPDAVAGKRVLVYDDICTTGAQLDAVARFLKEHGATHIEGLVLGRAQWW